MERNSNAFGFLPFPILLSLRPFYHLETHAKNTNKQDLSLASSLLPPLRIRWPLPSSVRPVYRSFPWPENRRRAARNGGPAAAANDIFDKIFSVPAYDGGDAAVAGMVCHLTSGDGTASVSTVAGGGSFAGTVFPPGLSPRPEVPVMAGRDLVRSHPIRPNPSQHCRERRVERMRLLQDLVPNSHKVLRMSRLRVAGAVPQVVADIPLSSVEGKVGEGGGSKPVWEKWSNNVMEEQVVKLMEDDGAAMQFFQSKAVCIIPISIATTIYQSHHQNEIPAAKPEPDTPS